jgi:cardiolipin synthase C
MIKSTGFLAIWLLLLALVGCAKLTGNVDRSPSKAFTDTGNTAIGNAIANETSDHPGQYRLFTA